MTEVQKNVAYPTDLPVIRYLTQHRLTEIQDLTPAVLADFQHWIYYQPTRKGSPRGVVNLNTILAAVKSFCRFLKVEGFLGLDPAEGLEYGRRPHSLPRNVLTPEEAKRIIESVDSATLLGGRDRTILEMLYATGVRNRELRRLTVADVDLEGGLLRVNQGKGRIGSRRWGRWPAGAWKPISGASGPNCWAGARATGFFCPTGAGPWTPIRWAISSNGTLGWPGQGST